jgi:hypothetical protein
MWRSGGGKYQVNSSLNKVYRETKNAGDNIQCNHKLIFNVIINIPKCTLTLHESFFLLMK